MAKRPLKPDEKRAWAQVAKSVRPKVGQAPPEMPPLDALILPSTATNPNQPRLKPSARALFPHLNTSQPPPKPASAPIQNRGKERRIRRGQAQISATIDLHGHTQESAQALLTGFLSSQRQQASTCVLVITGKGRRGEGVLRRQLLNWLETGQARALVSGYSQAHSKHGGSGAWYIFLRKRP